METETGTLATVAMIGATVAACHSPSRAGPARTPRAAATSVLTVLPASPRRTRKRRVKRETTKCEREGRYRVAIGARGGGGGDVGKTRKGPVKGREQPVTHGAS